MAHRTLVHTSHQPIRRGDMDALGHVNNAVGFRFMEQARVEWVQRLESGRDAGTGSVIVSASCTFLVPLVYPGEVTVRMYLGETGRSSVATRYELDEGGKRAAEGAARMVGIDLASGRPVPLPDPVRAAARGPE